MKAAFWGLGLLAGALSGCLTHQSHFEETPMASRVEPGRRLGDSSRSYALLVPRMDQLELRLRKLALCRATTLTRVRRDEVVEVRATDARWWAVGGFVLAGGSVLALGDGGRARAFGIALIGAGGVIAGVPLFMERTERAPAPERESSRPGEAVECHDESLGSVRVSVRVRGELLEAVSDAAGRVRFPGVEPTSQILVYVNDQAVPVVVGAPPTGTLPPGASPADPASPGKR